MTLANALATFRERLTGHCRWLSHNAARIEELSVVLDELKEVETTQRENDAVRKIAIRELSRQHQGQVTAFECPGCPFISEAAPGFLTHDPLVFFDHLMACAEFRDGVLTEVAV